MALPACSYARRSTGRSRRPPDRSMVGDITFTDSPGGWSSTRGSTPAACALGAAGVRDDRVADAAVRLRRHAGSPPAPDHGPLRIARGAENMPSARRGHLAVSDHGLTGGGNPVGAEGGRAKGFVPPTDRAGSRDETPTPRPQRGTEPPGAGAARVERISMFAFTGPVLLEEGYRAMTRRSTGCPKGWTSSGGDTPQREVRVHGTHAMRRMRRCVARAQELFEGTRRPAVARAEERGGPRWATTPHRLPDPSSRRADWP